MYLDAWTVDGVDVLPSTRSYCSAYGKTTYLGLATYGGTYAYLRRFFSRSSIILAGLDEYVSKGESNVDSKDCGGASGDKICNRK